MSGQTLTDRIAAAQYQLTGSDMARAVCKATTHEVMAPKKKHLDCKCTHFLYYSLYCRRVRGNRPLHTHTCSHMHRPHATTAIRAIKTSHLLIPLCLNGCGAIMNWCSHCGEPPADPMCQPPVKMMDTHAWERVRQETVRYQQKRPYFMWTDKYPIYWISALLQSHFYFNFTLMQNHRRPKGINSNVYKCLHIYLNSKQSCI